MAAHQCLSSTTMPSAMFLASVVVASGCAAPRPALRPAAAPAAAPAPRPAVATTSPNQPSARQIPAGDEVLIKDNAWLHAAHNLNIRFRYKALAAPLALDEVHRFEVLEDRGAWLIVAIGKNDRWPSRPCIYELMDFQAFEGVRLAVQRSALAQVTTRRSDSRFSDGTEISVWPGVPVGSPRPSDGWYPLGGNEHDFHAPLPADALGWSYRGWGPRREEVPRLDETIYEYAQLRLGMSERFPAKARHSAYAIAAPEVGADHRLVDVRTACYWAKLRVGKHAVSPRDDGDSSVGGLLGGRGDGMWYQVPTGATVQWQDGVPAGWIRRGFGTTAMSRQDDRYCMTTTLGGYGPKAERSFTLCIAAADVRVQKRHSLKKMLDKASPPKKPTPAPTAKP